jgi:hypothetical protein
MAAFSKIKAGDTLYDCRRQRMGNTTMSRMACWTVKVIEVDQGRRQAFCSWNTNTPTWWSERKLSTLRRSPVGP